MSQQTAVPQKRKRNFLHLYLDIFWFGVLTGSAINFMAIFATRQGATEWQMGLLNAAPGMVILVFSLPAGHYLRSRSVSKVTFWAAVFHRLFYLLWPFLPILFAPAMQVQWLVLSIFLMSIPGTALAIGFNNLLASTVPPEWRGQVVGRRNALLAAASILTSFVCGWILNNMSFTSGYQLVFGIGAFGALMSTIHLFFVKPDLQETHKQSVQENIQDWARPGAVRSTPGIRISIGFRAIMRGDKWRSMLNSAVLTGRYRTVLLLLFAFHLAQYTAIPLFPLYTVNELQLSDQVISFGNIFFYGALFLGSTQLSRLSGRWGHHTVLGLGAVLMCSYPLLVTLAYSEPIYYVASVAGGLAWTLAGGAVGNYLFEQIPDDDRPPYLAWYNLSLNAAVLLGSLIGPLLASSFTLVVALLIAAALRLLAGACLWYWG